MRFEWRNDNKIDNCNNKDDNNNNDGYDYDIKVILLIEWMIWCY